MMSTRVLACLFFVLPFRLAIADGPPTVTDLQQLIADNKYSAAVLYANRLLAIKGAAATDIDREQVDILKGEAQLHLKSYPQSADAFAAAAKEATDPHAMAVDKATEVLIRRSRHGAYWPKQPGPDGTKLAAVDIVTPANRTPAVFAALFADELAAAQPKLKSSKTIHAIPPLLAVIDSAITLKQIEIAATDKSDQSNVQLAALADHAHTLIGTALKTLDSRVTDIQNSANGFSIYYQRINDPFSPNGYRSVRKTRKNGLTDRNISELKDTIATCDQIGPACDQLSKASDAITDWEAQTANASRISSRAADVLNAGYSNGESN